MPTMPIPSPSGLQLPPAPEYARPPGAASAAAGASAHELTGVSFRAGGREIVANASLALRPGEFLAILGPNGAGKSTLLGLMNATLRPAAGAVRLFGRDPWAAGEAARSRLRARVGVIPQRAEFNPRIPLTAREVVAIGRLRGRAFAGRLSREDEIRIEEAMERLGVAPLARRLYRSLSGGEQQKTQIARALAQEPDLLLLDEPASGLDLPWQERLTDLIGELAATLRAPIVMTTHGLHHLPAGCGRAALMRGGRILFDGPAREALSAARLAGLYDYPVEVLERGGRRWLVGAAAAGEKRGRTAP